MKMYISSADMMTRNTQRRVETACPVLDRGIRARILAMLEVMLSDTKKARILNPDGTYSFPPRGEMTEMADAQAYFLEQAERAGEQKQESGSAMRRLWNSFRKRKK